MIKIEREQANMLYDAIRRMLMSREEYTYEKKQHRLYEPEASPELQANYYNEYGSVEIKTDLGEIFVIDINRWHPHRCNGWSGLNGVPCLEANISKLLDNEKIILWQLNVRSATLFYEARVTNTEFAEYLAYLSDVEILNDVELAMKKTLAPKP